MRTVLLIVTICLLTVVPSVVSAQNSCTECHAAQLDPWLWPTYQDWAKSPHYEEGVTCDKCHGGEPTSPTMEAAHRGVLEPTDPESKIHYTNVISTCGGDGSEGCHTEISEAYVESEHGKNVVEGNLAPDCRTCMGSHDVTLDTDHIILGCQKCMNPENIADLEPYHKAQSAFKMMEAAEIEISEAERLIKEAQSKGMNLTIAQVELEKAKAGMTGHDVKWHRFQPDDLTPQLMSAYYSAEAAREMAQKALREMAALQEPSTLKLVLTVGIVLIMGTSIILGGILIVWRDMQKKGFLVKRQ